MKFIQSLADTIYNKYCDERDDKAIESEIEVNERLFNVYLKIDVAHETIVKSTCAITVISVQEFDECGKVVFELGPKSLGKLNDILEDRI